MLSGKHVLFLGNSVVRRHMWSLVDVLGGPNATRRRRNAAIEGSTLAYDRAAVDRADAMLDYTVGSHSGQLVIVDTATGRFAALDPRQTCGVPAHMLERLANDGNASSCKMHCRRGPLVCPDGRDYAHQCLTGGAHTT